METDEDEYCPFSPPPVSLLDDEFLHIPEAEGSKPTSSKPRKNRQGKASRIKSRAKYQQKLQLLRSAVTPKYQLPQRVDSGKKASGLKSPQSPMRSQQLVHGSVCFVTVSSCTSTSFPYTENDVDNCKELDSPLSPVFFKKGYYQCTMNSYAPNSSYVSYADTTAELDSPLSPPYFQQGVYDDTDIEVMNLSAPKSSYVCEDNTEELDSPQSPVYFQNGIYHDTGTETMNLYAPESSYVSKDNTEVLDSPQSPVYFQNGIYHDTGTETMNLYAPESSYVSKDNETKKLDSPLSPVYFDKGVYQNTDFKTANLQATKSSYVSKDNKTEVLDSPLSPLSSKQSIYADIEVLESPLSPPDSEKGPTPVIVLTEPRKHSSRNRKGAQAKKRANLKWRQKQAERRANARYYNL